MMNKSVFVLSALLLGTLAGIVATPGAAGAAASASTALPAAQQAGLCGMTQEKVLGIEQYYDLDLDLPTIANALETPFDCGAYGRLCDFFSPPEAQTYVCKVWEALDNRLPAGVIIQKAHQHVATGGSCDPDADLCEDACETKGGVLSCEGVYSEQLGCLTTVQCQWGLLEDMEGFQILQSM